MTMYKQYQELTMTEEEAEKSVMLENQMGFDLEEICFFKIEGNDVIAYIHENDVMSFLRTVAFQEYTIKVESTTEEFVEGAYSYFGDYDYGVSYITTVDDVVRIRIYDQRFNIDYVMKQIM